MSNVDSNIGMSGEGISEGKAVVKKEDNNNISFKEAVKAIASSCEVNGTTFFMWCTRMSWAGTVTSVSDDCIILTNAYVVEDSGDFADDPDYSTCSAVPGGVVVVRIDSVESVFQGKRISPIMMSK